MNRLAKSIYAANSALRCAAVVALSLIALTSAHSAPVTLNVFAAASLTDAFKAIGVAYQQAHPDTTIVFNYAGSQVLVTQIQQGAPADVFASADMAHMDTATTAGLVNPPVVFAHNRLVVIAAPGSGVVQSLADLAKPGAKIVLANVSVPAGKYADESLAKLEASQGVGYAAKVQANVVSRENNVRAVLTKIELGEADAGIVYITDAESAKGKVTSIPIPAVSNVVATYPIAVIKSSPSQADAASFVSFCVGPVGQDILLGYGFERGVVK